MVLVVVEKRLLQLVLLSFMAGRRGMVFQQVNPRVHSARFTHDFLYRNIIVTMDWPTLSPELNPIKHLWDEIERRIDRRYVLPATVQKLTDAVLDAYNNIPRIFIRNLFRSMGCRCAAVINNNVGHTHY